jgi:hypothetical protein
MSMDSVWSRGRLWSAARIGAPAGIAFGLVQFALYGSVGKAIFGGLFFAVFFGAVMALIMWRSWQGARDLSSADRVAVARIVRRGEGVDDQRLAPSVLEHATAVRRKWERDNRSGWVLWIVAGLTLLLAFGATMEGSTRSAAVWWVLVAFWASFLTWLPRRRARVLSHASHAEAAARRLLGSPNE